MGHTSLSSASRTPRSGEPGSIGVSRSNGSRIELEWTPGLAALARGALVGCVMLLSACATALPQIVEREGDTFDVRYDAGVQTQTEVDARAATHCEAAAATYVSQQTGFDGLAYRTYRCTAR
jgi:hypothetical protein